jgi:hypothetical protein
MILLRTLAKSGGGWGEKSFNGEGAENLEISGRSDADEFEGSGGGGKRGCGRNPSSLRASMGNGSRDSYRLSIETFVY